MPLYEYCCADCQARFELLRPASQSDASAPCPRCGGLKARRAISVFAAISKDSSGSSRMVASSGGGGCAGCAGGSCGNCGH